MNIEEERKAFDKAKQQFDGSTGYFDVWLAAKAHAAEMAKPVVYITSTPVAFTVCLTDEHRSFNGILTEENKTQSDAEAWAKANGYRVIE